MFTFRKHGTSVTCLKFVFTSLLANLFMYAATAQLPGQLPVNLKTFMAMTENNSKIKVFWTTAYEKDNAYFDIERSVDGLNFTSAGKVPGINYNGRLTDYNFYDSLPVDGISFYRLKQVDTDGKFNYSPIAKVKILDSDNSFDIFPNPTTGREFRIDLLKHVPGNIDVAIFDAGGRLRLHKQYTTNSAIIIIHHLPAGIYTVNITGKEFKAAKNLVVQ